MKPYLAFIKAVMQARDPSLELETIRKVPLEKTLRLAGGVGAEIGPCKLRRSQRWGRQADIDTGRFRQGDGVFETFRPMQHGPTTPGEPIGRRPWMSFSN
jgi:hypothetical protein